LKIGNHPIGPGHPVYVIAELSANHNREFDRAARIVQAAKDAGADAIKLQTYTADTITLRSDKKYFQIGGGTLWDGRTLHDLYAEAGTPWEWHSRLLGLAKDIGLDFFSSPFDHSAVDFLEGLNVPAYKIASPELVDLPLIEKVASTGKPMIMSTGMATRDEIQEAIDSARSAGATQIVLLKCTSAYPAPPGMMNLRTIPELARTFGVPAGLSDHSLGIAVPVAAVALGACVIEKHLTLSRADKGPDAAFSLEPQEFKAMVDAVRVAEAALGDPQIGPAKGEDASRAFRRSLFVVEDMKGGEMFTEKNLRSIRPANGLHTRHMLDIMGKRCARDVERGTPLTWDLVKTE